MGFPANACYFRLLCADSNRLSLVGSAISQIAMDTLRKIRTKLDSGTRHLVIDELHRLEAEREPFADIVAWDRNWDVAVGNEDKSCDFMSQELIDPEACGLSRRAS